MLSEEMLPDRRILSNDIFYIEDLIYIPMGAYTEMFNRPYTVHMTKEGLETLAIRLEDTKAGKFTPSLVNGVASQILQPSQVPYPTVINKDWISTKRFIFLLKVVIQDAIGVKYNNYIQGYTEYDGISMNGKINPELNHYVNTIIETYKTVINNGIVYQEIEKLGYIYNVISRDTDNMLFLQRPTDIYEIKAAANASMFLNNSSNGYLGFNVYNTGSIISNFSSIPKTSKIDNGITTEYLSEVLNIGLHDKNNNSFISSLDVVSFNGGDTVDQFKRFEKSLHENRFMLAIKMIEGYNIVQNKFQFKSLGIINPDIYNRFKVINITKDYVNPLINKTPEVGDYWHGQDPVTIKAYSLIENAVSLALRYGFGKIFFTASNMANPTGESLVFIHDFRSFINLEEHDTNFLLEIFKEKFITSILLNETFENKINIHADFYIDIMGSSKIFLQYGTYPPNWYTIPTFANSHFSPVVSYDNNLVMANCNYLSGAYEVIDQIRGYKQPALPNYY